MSDVSIDHFRRGPLRTDLHKVVDLYNRSCTEVHGFHPLAPARYRRRVLKSPRFRAHWLLTARRNERIVGILHADVLRPPCPEEGGVVELVAVAPEERGKGIGAELLDEALARLDREKIPMVDGGGTYPFSPFYATLLDGSERSGVDADNQAALALFTSRGFRAHEESVIMRADLEDPLGPLEPDLAARRDACSVRTHPRGRLDTWLDHAFRGWGLVDSYLVDRTGGPHLSRAIYAHMPGLSAYEGRSLYAIFGVHTPRALRGKGHATVHFRKLRDHLAEQGAQELELHVRAHNRPALGLYRKVGFREIGRTVTLRRWRHS